ncbi:hypothetical protein LJC36_00455 [Desulfovibrio sp. OttesenSCG-928-C14]|nr:hypothetical protein [Desulfovibrio sp. OttesenSCG-928-C14]
MSFHNLSEDMKYCAEHLDLLAVRLHRPDGRIKAVASGLTAILSAPDLYEVRFEACRAFASSFERNLARLRVLLASEDACAQEVELEDLCFLMVEELAVILREKYLRSGCAGQSPQEKKLAEYFETRGHWRYGDSTLVSSLYYLELPVAALARLLDLIRQQGAGASQAVAAFSKPSDTAPL